MWKLEVPDKADAIKHLDIGLNIGPGLIPTYALSGGERVRISSIYRSYDRRLGRAATNLEGPGVSVGLKQALHDAYDLVQDGRRLKDLRASIKLRAQLCPYCGFGPIQEIDHHLPKTHYKLLAIYIRNLVPICATCNRKKSANVGAHMDSQFLNVYLERIPQEIFLVANVTLNAVSGALTVIFYIVRSASMSKVLHKRLISQMMALGLNDRYAAPVNQLLSEHEVALETAYGADNNSARVRRFLEMTVMAYEKRFGLNDWRTALMRAISAHGGFCAGAFRTALGKPQPGA